MSEPRSKSEVIGLCGWCGFRPAVRVCPDGDGICRPCLIDLAEQEREEDEPLGEWDEDAYFEAFQDRYGEDEHGNG